MFAGAGRVAKNEDQFIAISTSQWCCDTSQTSIADFWCCIVLSGDNVDGVLALTCGSVCAQHEEELEKSMRFDGNRLEWGAFTGKHGDYPEFSNVKLREVLFIA